MDFKIKRGDIERLEEIQRLNFRIFQEFWDKPYTLDYYTEKLKNKNPLIITASRESQLVGDLIAYPKRDSFYIWLLAVERQFRRQEIGSKLLEECEIFARQQRFSSTSSKSYNVSRDMQRLLIKRGYLISGLNVSEEDKKYNAVLFELPLR